MPKSTRAELDAFRAAVVRRDEITCQLCGVDVTYKLASVHHRIPRGMGGSRLVNVVSNGVLICGSATTPGSCHDFVEHVDRRRAEQFGYLIPKLSGAHPSEVPIWTRWHGWVLLTDDGNRVPCIGAVGA